MATEPILFFDDLMHASKSGISLTVSSTKVGYNKDNVRDTNLATAWAPADSAIDEWIECDHTPDTLFGGNSENVWHALAYDARGVNQALLKVQSFDGTSWADALSHTLEKTGVGCFYGEVVGGNPAYTKWRLMQASADRSGGNVMAKVFSWAIFDKDRVYRVGVSPYAAEGHGPHSMTNFYRVGSVETSGGHMATNKYGESGQEFELTFRPAAYSFWKDLRDRFHEYAGANRAIYIRKDGLRNPAQADFFLCRLVDVIEGSFFMQNVVLTAVRFRTEAWV